MNGKWIRASVFWLIVLMAAPVLAQPKKRVAVFTFEDKTDKSWQWWDNKTPGDGMADMLTTELVKSGKYTVIERKEIDQIMQEQNLGMTGRITEQSAAQVGKLLGVELAVVGAVTEFGGTKGDTGGRIKGFGIGVSKQTATVAVDVRFINTNTGEILAADNVRKEESSSGLNLSTNKFSFNNENEFDNSLVGKATRACIEDIMALVEKQMVAMPWEGKIIMVNGADIFMKPGSDSGIKVGDTFTVYRLGQDLIDPDTGLSLGSTESKIGTIEVTGFVSGGKAAKAVGRIGSGFDKGDVIRLK